ncbi:MAG: prepilin-type N-terminal cleavage/methylation domain-containing protein [Verrucomicrobiota bacterium]
MKPIPTLKLARGIRGFTLVEMITAMAITVIILIVLLSITGIAFDTWGSNRDRVRAARQAKIALDQMARDFESFQVRSGNGFEWLYARVDEEVGGAQVRGGNVAQLVFFTSATDRYNGQIRIENVDRGGDVSAVGYRLVYKDPIENNNGEFSVFALYRNLVDPDASFEELLGREELLEPGGVSGPFEEYMNEVDGISNFLSENIYDITLGFLVEYKEVVEGRLVTKHERLSIIDTSGEGAVEELRVKGNGIFAEPSREDAELIQNGRLVSVDISITVLTDTAMDIIQADQLSRAQFEKFIKKNSFRHAKTVILPHS